MMRTDISNTWREAGVIERPLVGQPVGVEWNSDGSYTPLCQLCRYEGKRRWEHSVALAALRQHVRALSHRRRLKETK
jgi:hypothetical protein